MEIERFEVQRGSIYHLLATSVLQAQKIGNYVKGYIDGKENLEHFLKQYDESSNSKFIVRSSNKKKSKDCISSKGTSSNGDNATGSRYGCTERLYWEFNNRNLYVPFTGIPFVVNSSQIKHCQYGSKYYKTKQPAESGDWSSNSASVSGSTSKRRQLKQSKKRNCPAYLNVREIILFPDFMIPPETLASSKCVLRNEKVSLLNKLRTSLQCNNLNIINRFFVEIPLPEAHSDHPSDANISGIRSLNPFVKAKLDQLLMFEKFRYEKRHIHLIIQDYIQELLLNNSMSVTQCDYPTEEEISDYIFLATISAPTIVEVHTKEYSPDDKPYEPQSSMQREMQKSLEELKTMLQSCTDNDILWDVKIQVKRMIQKLTRNSSNNTGNPSNFNSLLGKRCYSSMEKQPTPNDFSSQNNAVDSTVQEINEYVSGHNGAPLMMHQPNYNLQSQEQFQAKEPNSNLIPTATSSHVSSNDNMLSSFSRFMESDQEILPSIVDQVVTDVSHPRPTPYGNFQYFPQYPHR